MNLGLRYKNISHIKACLFSSYHFKAYSLSFKGKHKANNQFLALQISQIKKIGLKRRWKVNVLLFFQGANTTKENLAKTSKLNPIMSWKMLEEKTKNWIN